MAAEKRTGVSTLVRGTGARVLYVTRNCKVPSLKLAAVVFRRTRCAVHEKHVVQWASEWQNIWIVCYAVLAVVASVSLEPRVCVAHVDARCNW